MQGQSECLSETQAVANAYEYKWLRDALQPLQNPVGEDVRYDGGEGWRFDEGSSAEDWLREHVLGSACYGNTNLVPAFCRAYLSVTGGKAVAVHAAKGSTEIKDWLPGTPGYAAIVQKARGAIQKVKEQGELGRIYFVWLQGESDAIYSCGKRAYMERLLLLQEGLVRDLNVHTFGIIRVGRFTGDARDDAIIEAQRAACKHYRHFLMLSELADELEEEPACMNPNVGGHFGAKGLEMLGADAGRTLGKHRTGEIVAHKIYARYPLGNKSRAWKQDNFVLSNFSARASDMRKCLRNCKDAGFNTVEIGWATHEQAEEAVIYCEQEGLDLIFQDLSRYGGMQKYRHCKEDALTEVIREKRAYKRLVGYYIWDEPWKDDQLEAARKLTDECEGEAPDLLPFTVAIPSYNPDDTWESGTFAAYLERYVTTINPPILSLDYYPVGLPGYTLEKQLDDSKMWLDLGCMKVLGEKYGLPLWFYYQGVDLHKAGYFTFPMIRSMMYAATLYGCKGLQHFSAVGSIIDEHGNKEWAFEDQKVIHEEFRNLGGTLMALTSKRVMHDASVDTGIAAYTEMHQTEKDSAYLSAPLPKRASVAELEDDYGNGYIMILNRDYEVAQTFDLPLNGNYRLYEVSKTDGCQYVIADSTDHIEVTLDKGDAVLYRIQNASEEAFTVEYRLMK